MPFYNQLKFSFHKRGLNRLLADAINITSHLSDLQRYEVLSRCGLPQIGEELQQTTF